MNDLKVMNKSLAKFKKQWLFLFSCTFCFILTAWFIVFLLVNPEYKSTSQLFIGNSSLTITQLEKRDSPQDSQMIEGYAAYITSAEVLEKVNENLMLTKSIPDLRKQVHVSNIDNSPILTITTSSDIKNESERIINMLTYIFKEEVQKSLNKDNVTVISSPLTESEFKKSNLKDVAKGIAFTTILSFVISGLLVISIGNLKKGPSRRERENGKKDLRLQTVFK